MKKLLIGACALALALNLSACASPGAVTGATSVGTGIDVATLKEVNRHIETCDRTYAWPFSIMIVCKAQPPAAVAPAAAPITAAEVAAMIADALAKVGVAH